MSREGALEARRLKDAFRVVLHPLLAAVVRILFEYRVEGAFRIPRRGPAVLVANHQGYLDPLFLQMATTRPIRYLMTSDFYDIPAARPFFRLVGAVRVPETGSRLETLREARRLLDEGDLVGIFPEGRISVDGTLGELRPGAAFLAARTGAPVIPVGIDGSIRVLPKGRWRPRQAAVRLRFGPPVRLGGPRDEAPIREALGLLLGSDHSGRDS